jgi:nucleotide-binding universal stress UspA family protein
MNLSRILFPCDFNDESFVALQHAAAIAEKSNAEIVLMHMTDQPDQIDPISQKLEAWKQKINAEHEGPVAILVEEGGILEEIAAIAEREECQLVVMPTHGMTGAQIMQGSLALRVITESSTPFIVVQKRPIREKSYRKILVPVEYRSQLLDIENLLVDFVKLFNAEVYLYTNDREAKQGDASIPNKLKQFLEERGIAVNLSGINSLQYNKALLRYAAEIDADLIWSVNFAYENIFSAFPSTYEEELIYNTHGIPVFLITPENLDDDVDIRPDDI